jgi:hypothetical protein
MVDLKNESERQVYFSRHLAAATEGPARQHPQP